jgi:hypothetical protein
MYSPKISDIVDSQEDRWGNPEENRKNLVPYGVPILDKNLYGVGVDRGGELILFIGEEKMRKTTLVINILINIMTNNKVFMKPFTVIDTLESGMPPEKYVDNMTANLASRYLLATGHSPISSGYCKACENRQCKELRLDAKYLYYMGLTKEQKFAVERARDTMRGWPIELYGTSFDKGDTRNLEKASGFNGTSWELEIAGKKPRWIDAIERGMRLLVVDHAQQFSFMEGFVNDYEKLVRVVAALGDVVGKYEVVNFLVSQISLSSIREAKAGGKLTASGGRKPHQEANAIVSTGYQEGSGIMKVSLEGSRESGTGFEEYSIEDISGALYDGV